MKLQYWKLIYHPSGGKASYRFDMISWISVTGDLLFSCIPSKPAIQKMPAKCNDMDFAKGIRETKLPERPLGGGL